jgi:hypothetical protein
MVATTAVTRFRKRAVEMDVVSPPAEHDEHGRVQGAAPFAEHGEDDRDRQHHEEGDENR